MYKMKQGLLMSIIFVGGVFVTKLLFVKKHKPTPTIKNEKNVLYYNLLNQWLMLKNNDISIVQKFVDVGLNNIAIYGMGEIGHRLYEELQDSEVTVSYGIDNSPNKNNSNLSVFSLNNNLADVDAIVVTAIFDYENICKNIKNYCDIKVISLEDVLFDNL